MATTSRASQPLTRALQQALHHARTGISSAPDLQRAAELRIEQWKKFRATAQGNKKLATVHAGTASTLSLEELRSLNLYLCLQATTIANHVLLWAPQTADQDSGSRFSAVQALAGAHLLVNLMDERKTEDGARLETLHTLQSMNHSEFDQLAEQWRRDTVASRRLVALNEGNPHPEVARRLHDAVEEARALLKREPTTPVVRIMAGLYNQVAAFCVSQGLPNHLRNVSIGDVDPNGLPPDIRERNALDPFGPKSLAVAARAKAYLTLAGQGGSDWQRYDIPALGWEALRNRFVEYAIFFNLYESGSNPKETLIAAGGQHGLGKALLVARNHLRAIGVKNPAVYFSNPGLRMISNFAREHGFQVMEPVADPDNHFFPDVDLVRAQLDAQPNCKIFINTPMGNPNGAIEDSAKMEALQNLLADRKMIVINDLAYFGMGDLEKNRRIAQVLSSYPDRIDVIPMTKIFGRPGLRCSCVMTPNAEFAARFKPVAQGYQPTESYAMQAEALALWDFVSNEDRLALAQLFQQRQSDLIGFLKSIDRRRGKAGKPLLLDAGKPLIGDASLYVLAPLAEGIDPFSLVEETGLVGTPAAGFFADLRGGWMRFSVGIEGMTV